MRAFAAVVIALISLISLPTRGRAQDAQGRDEGLSIGASEIVVDVVVRDDKGRIVKDLAAADFEVLEDNVAQDVTSFRFESSAGQPMGNAQGSQGNPSRSATSGTVAPRASGQVDTAEDSPASVAAVALVFDRLAPEARIRARDSALRYVNSGLHPDDLVGVFVTDLSLRVLQSFTRDPALVRKAVDAVALQAQSTAAGSTGEQTRSLGERVGTLQQTQSSLESSMTRPVDAAGGAAASAAGAAIGANDAELMAAEMTQRSLETFEAPDRDQQGYATTNGLLAVVNALGRVPGRKAIIFFSEGIAIPPNVEPQFRSVIGNANRANVSIYTVDAAGLRVVSPTSETAKELNAVARRRMQQVASGSDNLPSLTRILERNEDMLRANPEGTLGHLANETGGFLVSGTNDPSSRLRQVDEDLRSHYVLSYSPKNQEFDGQFRRIAVRVKRQGMEVRAREGYYAVGAIGSLTVLPYEARPLAALDKRKDAKDFPSATLGLVFPEPGHPGRVPVLVEVPASALTCTPDSSAKVCRTDFTIVAVIKDAAEQVVRKLSSHYTLGLTPDRVSAFQKGNVLFFRETTLDPGVYSLETIAYDMPSGKANVRRRTLVVPSDDKLRLSSVVLVARVDHLKPDERVAADSLRVGDELLYPTLGASLSKSRDKRVTFFVTAYTNPRERGAAKLAIQILKNGRVVGQVPADLPSADAQGRVQFVNALALDALSPGAYELRVTLSDSRESAATSSPFTVVP
jgi:VWFA-related protein